MTGLKRALNNHIPALEWLRAYNRRWLTDDLVAAVIVTVMLIPQSLAYALLAGVPPEMGLYASILPLIGYAIFGTSRTLSVGPVAVASLMTAAAAGKAVADTGVDYVSATVVLALLSGAILTVSGLFRLGFLANFLSHPVVAGFITASGIIIALGQVRHLLGIEAHGENMLELVTSLTAHLSDMNPATLAVGGGVLIFLLWARHGLPGLLHRLGVSDALAGPLSRASPIVGVIVTIALARLLDLEARGIALVGDIPAGLPAFGIPSVSPGVWLELLASAALISIIGYVESISVGRTLAAKRRQRINPDKELIALGAANMASGISSGFPVTGGFSRSVVNFDAGAQTPAASIMTAAGIAVAAVTLTPLLYYLPKATLAATIIVAVMSLIDLHIFSRAWHYGKSDFAGLSVTVAVTLAFGVELGVLAGVISSAAIHLYKTSRPHVAVVGEVPGTEHFRNVLRHQVITHPHIVSIRIDESLYFANAAFLEDTVYGLIHEKPELNHVILMCSAVNEIDLSALDALEAINQRLKELGISFNLSEVKGPVMDCLQRSEFLQRLNGRVFLTQHQAVETLRPADGPRGQGAH